MKRFFTLFGAILLAAIVSSSDLSAQEINEPLNNPFSAVVFDSIKLQKTNGKIVDLSEFKNINAFILVFTCNHCPFAKLYTDRLNKLSNQYAKNGVQLIAINSMDSLLYEEERLEFMKEKEQAFDFLYLKDFSQDFARAFQAENTPQAFVVWKTNGKFYVAYKGAIDDNGQELLNVKNPYVELALNSLLNNKRVLTPVTESFGCKIFYRTPKRKD